MLAPRDAFVVIPTYWTWPSAEAGRPTTAAYDHPTPLDNEGTLPPLLEDLAFQRAAGFKVLILTGRAHPDLGGAVSDRVQAMLAPFQARLSLHVCDSDAVERLLQVLRPSGLQSGLIQLGSYASIRNLQLLVPHILGAQAVIALDDDERVDPDYIERALSNLGATVGAGRALGIAGPYLQPDGGVLLKEAAPTGNPLRDKAHHINAAMRGLTAGGKGLVPSPVALGGNMVFHRDLFTRVCFDPGITRGEDIDYLINARLEGIAWWFDPQLSILHLPPRHLETPEYQRTREDVFRFIHEREKLRLYGYERPEWLEPYPGALLGADLEQHALAALKHGATPEMVARLGAPQEILQQARRHAAQNAGRYREYALAWRVTLADLEQNTERRAAAAAAFTRS